MLKCWKPLVFVGLLVLNSSATLAVGTDFDVQVSVTGSGSGMITDSSGYISCMSTSGTASGTCSSGPNYSPGFTATITATPTSTSSFSSWSGCTSTSGNICYVAGSSGSIENVTVEFGPDITAPTASISGVPSATDGSTPFTVTYTFSEDIGSTFVIADIAAALSNASVSSLTTVTSGTVFTAIITPDGAGDVSVGLNGSAVSDSAGNSNLPVTDETATLDTTNPTVTITGVPNPNYGPLPFTVTYTFSEEIVGFNAADVVAGLVDGTVTDFTEVTTGLVYTMTINPPSTGDSVNGIGLLAGSVHDLAGNPNDEPTALLSISIDDSPPTILITGVPSTTDGSTAFTVTYKFNEDTEASFVLSDVTAGLTNATASDFIEIDEGLLYTALITPDGSGDVTILLLAGAVQNSDAYATTTDSTSYTAVLTTTADTTSPTVTISADVEAFDGTTPFNAIFNFSEGVTGFDLADITVGNGAASSLTGTGDSYSAVITPTDTGNVTIDIAAGAANDGSGNGNIAAEQFVLRNTVVKKTQDRIVQTMQSRANQLVSSQTSLFGFLQGGRGGFFNADGSESVGYFHLNSKGNGLFWFDIKGSWTNEGGTETTYGHGTLGSHIVINENLLLGGMFQFDLTENKDATSTVKSRGWLTGPYIIGRHPTQDLYFEGAVLYGQTYNKIKPSNTYEDSFTTDRWLFRGAVTGEIANETISFFPNLKVTHTTDHQRAYTDSLANTISSQSISLTELSAGVDFNKPVQLDGKDLALIGGISGIWSKTHGAGGSAPDIIPSYDGGRAKIHLGLNYKVGKGASSAISGYFDGIGAKNFQSYGASVSFKKRF